jgi:hypothetical protein
MTEMSGGTGHPLAPGVASHWRGRLRGFCRRIGIALAAGYVLVFFAERMFWSRWRTDDDNVGAFLATWFVYSIAAEICLIAIRDFRVRDIWPMFLLGALLGWLIEGVFTMTFFGADGIPFPLTIAWTGLSWHALIVVVAGWYGLQTALLLSFARTALLSAVLGLFWGGWSIFWDRQSPPGSAEGFIAHSFIATIALILAFRTLPVLHCGDLRPTRTERVVLAAIVLCYFIGVTLARFNWIALVTLPPLFALIYLALRRNATDETRPDFLVAIDAPFPWIRALPIFLIPALASLIHEGCRIAGLTAPTNIVVFAITLPAGFGGFVFSLWRVFRRRAEQASSGIR